jgi:hypothetical protein
MAVALVTTYRSWKAEARHPYKELKPDFFEKNKPIFKAAKASFFNDLNEKGPFPFRPEVGQSIIAIGEQAIGGGLSIDDVYKWREDAWEKAGKLLDT